MMYVRDMKKLDQEIDQVLNDLGNLAGEMRTSDPAPTEWSRKVDSSVLILRLAFRRLSGICQAEQD